MPNITTAVRLAAATAAIAAGTTAGIAAAAEHTPAKTRAEAHHADSRKHAKIRKKAHKKTHAKKLTVKSAAVSKADSKSHKRKHKHGQAPTTSTPTVSTPTVSEPTVTAPIVTTPLITPAPIVTTPAPTVSTPPTTTTTTTTTTSSTPEPVGVSGNWSMVFDDEFNNSSLNTSEWGDSGYTNNNMTGGAKASNVSESGGDLHLAVDSQVVSDFGVAVGDYVEASVDFPGSGSTVYNWPAFWISGPDWPDAGETDIFEGLGTATFNYHYPGCGEDCQAGPFDESGTWTNQFNTFGALRQKNDVEIFWNGQLIKTIATDDDGQPDSIIFTNGIGNTADNSADVLVNYVRVWAPAS